MSYYVSHTPSALRSTAALLDSISVIQHIVVFWCECGYRCLSVCPSVGSVRSSGMPFRKTVENAAKQRGCISLLIFISFNHSQAIILNPRWRQPSSFRSTLHSSAGQLRQSRVLPPMRLRLQMSSASFSAWR